MKFLGIWIYGFEYFENLVDHTDAACVRIWVLLI